MKLGLYGFHDMMKSMDQCPPNKDKDNDKDKEKEDDIIIDEIKPIEHNMNMNMDKDNKDEIVQIDTPEYVKYIVKNIMQPEYLRDITSCIIWRKRFKKITYILYILSKICTFISSILAFLELSFTIGYLALASGCMSLLAIFLWQCGDYAYNNSIRKTRTINDYLSMLKIEGLPDDNIINISKRSKNN